MKTNTKVSKPPSPETSNAISLTGRQWIGVGLFVVVLFVFAPFVWQHFEPLDVTSDYRMPYDLSADYWLYERYSRLAAAQFDTLVFGDSVVWGDYVTPEQTLSHYLNESAGEAKFANLGVAGAHPVVLAGLLEHYAKGVSGKSVVLQCNPLWLTSDRTDLQIENYYPFNHPRLLPQFQAIPARPKEDVSQRIGIEVEKRVPFSRWTSHLQQAYFQQTDIPSWTLEHPYDNPLGKINQGLLPPEQVLRNEPIPWTARGIPREDYAWVELDTSLQWRFFRRTVDILRQRGNQVFVLLGPFNEHMLTDTGLAGYQKVKTGMEAWLREKGIAYWAPPALPSPEYADASHPLSTGYAALARELVQRLK